MTKLTHQDGDGSLHMVNVGDKVRSKRRALATGKVHLKSAYEAVKNDQLKKGSVFECARVAGILAAKNTGNTIPLCHPINLDSVSITFKFEDKVLLIDAEVCCEGKTGVEMEALSAVSAACLTVYDMAKGVEKGMVISDLHLLEKEGGKSGNWKFSQ